MVHAMHALCWGSRERVRRVLGVRACGRRQPIGLVCGAEHAERSALGGSTGDASTVSRDGYAPHDWHMRCTVAVGVIKAVQFEGQGPEPSGKVKNKNKVQGEPFTRADDFDWVATIAK